MPQFALVQGRLIGKIIVFKIENFPVFKVCHFKRLFVKFIKNMGLYQITNSSLWAYKRKRGPKAPFILDE